MWMLFLEDPDSVNYTNKRDTYVDLIKEKNCNDIVYRRLKYNENAVRKYFERWVELWRNLDLQDVSEYNYALYQEEFIKLQWVKIVKYKDFLYRLLLKKIVLNVDLFELGYKR